MKTKTRKAKARRSARARAKVPEPSREERRTRPPDAPLDPVVARSYKEVQPTPFGGDPRSSIEDAIADPDVEDTIGGQ